MLADSLLKDLAAHMPYDEVERISLDRIRELLENSVDDDVFDRERNNHHITGSSFVISPVGLLLHFHKKIPMWMQPGGHVDAGEGPRDAAERETFEEMGIPAIFEDTIFHVDVHDTPAGHTHYDIRYLARTENTYLRPPSDESQKVAWFTIGALSTLTDTSIIGATNKIVTTGLL